MNLGRCSELDKMKRQVTMRKHEPYLYERHGQALTQIEKVGGDGKAAKMYKCGLCVCLSVYLISNESTYKISNCLFVLALVCSTSVHTSINSPLFFQLFSFLSFTHPNFSDPVVSPPYSAIWLEHLVVIRQRHLSLIARLLVVLPGLFAVALLLGHALVLEHDLALVFGDLGLPFVFEHATHAKDGVLLGRVRLLLLLLLELALVLLAHLLCGPVVLVLRVQPHAIVVH